MSEKPLNNTEKAIAYIAKHPGCRSPEISEAIGVPTCNVTAILSSPVQAGYVVACKVECPGKPAMNEYRISATVAEDKVSWAEFRVAKRAKLPLTLAKPRPMRTAPSAPIPSKATQPLDAAPPPKTETPPATTPAPKVAAPLPATIPAPPAPSAKAAPVAQAILFLFDSNGQLRIEMPDGEQFFVTRRETQALGNLMKATELVWSKNHECT